MHIYIFKLNILSKIYCLSQNLEPNREHRQGLGSMGYSYAVSNIFSVTVAAAGIVTTALPFQHVLCLCATLSGQMC